MYNFGDQAFGRRLLHVYNLEYLIAGKKQEEPSGNGEEKV